MALSDKAKQYLKYSIASQEVADEVVAALEADATQLDVDSEQTARIAADLAEQSARIAADLAEQSARIAADLVLQSRQAAAVAVIGTVADLVGVDGTGSNAAPLAETESRLDTLESKVDELITALKNAGLML